MTAHSCPGVFVSESNKRQPHQSSGRALFLDRDGVINVDHGYVYAADNTDWVPGIFDLCVMARDAGFGLIVVTNQSGIARGYYSEGEFLEYTRWVHAQFEERGVPLLATYYCPHHPEAGLGEWKKDCDCRKPKPGMILAAADDFDLRLGSCVLVGDKASDLQAADAAGIGASFMVDMAIEDMSLVFRQS
ncbi:D-glycero-alpha-D-manno-heptose-1,7-bisphosphate 7-phosphatase [Dyella sp. Tek66A03]|uniref:D-glycero-alpha-D-manno-heptose-1,7-bisphosphate 7-phosphatase n=1 Tax=Dyella sp. Tek66A03 TaxID=3458298 RepID=UPI00403E91F7